MFVGMAMCQPTGSTEKDYERFLLDSGASCHIVKSEAGLHDLEDTDETVIIGDKSEMRSTKQGTLVEIDVDVTDLQPI